MKLLWILILQVNNDLTVGQFYTENPGKVEHRHTDHKDPIYTKYGQIPKNVAFVEKLRKLGVSHFITIILENSKCTDGQYYMTDRCNLCYCAKDTLQCTAVKCTKEKANLGAMQKLNTDGNTFYKEMRDKATKCKPDVHQVVIDENHNCPCTCIIPSVIYCPLCPAVERMVIPRRQRDKARKLGKDNRRDARQENLPSF